MTRALDSATPYQMLCDLQLGDVVTVGAGTPMSVRAMERQLATDVGTMRGFILAGEVGPACVLLGVPTDARRLVTLYSPINRIPEHLTVAEVSCQGAVSYWAPHLEGFAGGLGELGYKVARVHGSLDPLVVLWRGPERVVFVRTGSFGYDQLVMERLARDPSKTNKDVTRMATRVLRDGAPDSEQHIGGQVERLTRLLRRVH